MRETERSLRHCFLAAGILGILIATVLANVATEPLTDASKYRIGVRLLALAGLAFGFGVGYAIAGARLPDDLARGAGWVRSLVLASLGGFIALLVAAGAANARLAPAPLVMVLFAIALTAYVLANLRRLTSEAVARTGVVAIQRRVRGVRRRRSCTTADAAGAGAVGKAA